MSTTNATTADSSTTDTKTVPSFEGEADLQFDSVIGMTAADALREGAKSLHQKFGSWGDGKATGCALTAMHHAVKGKGYA